MCVHACVRDVYRREKRHYLVFRFLRLLFTSRVLSGTVDVYTDCCAGKNNFYYSYVNVKALTILQDAQLLCIKWERGCFSNGICFNVATVTDTAMLLVVVAVVVPLFLFTFIYLLSFFFSSSHKQKARKIHSHCKLDEIKTIFRLYVMLVHKMPF